MRWHVEVSSLSKTDTQKLCVDAESWQRALQAARLHRGEDGPMSGFSVELLEEGYRAVDPVARVRFVVKRAPDDTPVTPMPARESKGAVAPATKSVPPTPSSASAGSKPAPPRPGQSQPPPASPGSAAMSAVVDPSKKAQTIAFGSQGEPKLIDKPVERATPPAIGSAIPGLPPVKLLTSREQDPTEGSPLTYREYAFAVPDGTSEEMGADVLRAQLRYVEAHLATARTGRLVNLAVFDVEFTGKPPKPPIATLTWKDWKGEPVIGFPKRGGTPSKLAPGPPSRIPPSLAPSLEGSSHAAPPVPRAAGVPQIVPASVPPPAPVASAPPPAPASSPPPAQLQAQMPRTEIAVSAQPAFPAPKPPSQPPPAPAPVHPVTPAPPPAATIQEHRRAPSQPPDGGMVRTPSGRFIRGRITGDELISALFESMHDLHFLRDALDGGQFCLALATEVLPARAAIIHFFDLEKREWVVACTRGRDMQRLLAMRSPDTDEILRESARKRRALVIADASSAPSERYKQIGGARSLIAAPILQAGRALGALEIINPLDGKPFTEDEGNAITYIAEQYAEYLGSRGIVLDRARIQAAAAH